MQFFDSHAHLSSPEILPDIDGVMTRSRIAQISRILNICTDRDSLQEGLLLQNRFPQIINAGATTPHDVEKEGDEMFPIFAEAAANKKLAAVGETGLDYHYAHSDRQVQKKFLTKYLQLAADTGLPVIFHCREAFSDLFEIAAGFKCKAALHCFTGTMEEAEKVLSLGWYLSLSGIVTFKKSEPLREVAKMVPLNQLLIETDAPYLAPQSKRGQCNEPSFVAETAKCIAEIKKTSLETVASATFENAVRFLSREDS